MFRLGEKDTITLDSSLPTQQDSLGRSERDNINLKIKMYCQSLHFMRKKPNCDGLSKWLGHFSYMHASGKITVCPRFYQEAGSVLTSYNKIEQGKETEWLWAAPQAPRVHGDAYTNIHNLPTTCFLSPRDTRPTFLVSQVFFSCPVT